MISPHASNLPQMRRVNQQLTATKLKQLHTKPTLLAIALTSGILCASTALAQTDIKPDYRVSASGLPWFNYNPSMIDPKPEQFPLGIVFKGREAAKKPFATMLTNTHLLNVFMLKFKDGLAVKYDGKQFVLNEKKLPNADLRRGTAKLNDNAKRESSRQIETLFLGVPGVSIIPLVNKPQAEHDAEMSRLDDYSPVPLADMATYFTITLPEKSSRETTMRLINALNANDAVELAEPISIMTTPSVKAKTSPRQQSLVLSSTPDFSYLQTYLQSAAAPDRTGIGATYAWTFPGGKGEGTRFLDVEFDWNIAHEDLKAPFPSFGMLGLLPPSLTPRGHGITAPRP